MASQQSRASAQRSSDFCVQLRLEAGRGCAGKMMRIAVHDSAIDDRFAHASRAKRGSQINEPDTRQTGGSGLFGGIDPRVEHSRSGQITGIARIPGMPPSPCQAGCHIKGEFGRYLGLFLEKCKRSHSTIPSAYPQDLVLMIY